MTVRRDGATSKVELLHELVAVSIKRTQTGALQEGDLAMSSNDDLRDLVRRIYPARVEGDLESLMSFLDDDCLFRVVGNQHLAPLTDPVVGAAALRVTMQYLIDNWDMRGIDFVSIHVDGDVALIHRMGRMRFGATEYDTEIMDKMTFENGKLKECVEFIDTLQAAALLDVVKLPTRN
ncbi:MULTISPECIES: nuclear transport factor 2 family protein [Rhizobium]|nr:MULTISPECIES: nuclear transport factor 2 family protein [Rhizobium]MCS0462198.1 nuclear transport factor 2 family protein [Rhizobium favelukesii]UFS80903.1 nuclear transport factor 2 family protein [Rhizobium sp. T136]